MNFRTTILLLVVLAAAAAVFFFTSGRDTSNERVKDDPSAGPGKKLVDLTPANVSKVVVTSSGGAPRLAFEREGSADWRLVEPVRGPAESYKVDDLVREVLDLRTTGRTDASGKGLEQPQYVVELTDREKRTTKVNVGSRSAVGDILYVRVGDESTGQADVVSASIVERLDKPASEYRKLRLLSGVTNEKITAVTVEQGGQTLRLNKAGDKWQITEPKQMPGDAGQVGTLLSAITGLDAVKFVAEDLKDPAAYGLNKPQMTVSFSTAPPETQPTTGPAAGATTTPATGADATVIKFGRPQDVLRKNVFAAVSNAGPVVTVAATELDAFKKAPLDLRDREVLNVNADAVSRVSITAQKGGVAGAATQPSAATQPAEKREVVLERRSEVTTAGPPVPAAPAATPEATPAVPAPEPTTPSPAPAAPSQSSGAPQTTAPAPAPSAPAPSTPAPAAPQPQSQSQGVTPDGEGAVSLAAFQAEPAPAPTAQPPAAPAAQPPSAPRTPAAPADTPAAPGTPAAASTTAPTTRPTTAPAATQPAVPAAPLSKWLLVSEPKGDANDANVQTLLSALRPLRAEKFLETFPTTQAAPAAVYTVKLNTRSWADEPAREHVLTITDPGGDAKLIGRIGDLTFELDRAIVSTLTADFTPAKLPPAGPALPNPPGAPGGFPDFPAGADLNQ